MREVALEQRTGNVIPDIVCTATDAAGQDLGTLMVEVTVTNRLDDERVRRLRATGTACIEIDLSATGGRISREDLQQPVLRSTAIKRWIYFPGEGSARGTAAPCPSQARAAPRKRHYPILRRSPGARPACHRCDMANTGAAWLPPLPRRPAAPEHRREWSFWLEGAALEQWLRQHPENTIGCRRTC